MGVSKEAAEQLDRACRRLHHLSMRYGGAIVELAKGQKVGLIEKDYPGLKEMRDLVDLVLICRAEINALTKSLLDAGVIDADKFTRQQAEDIEWITRHKASFLGCEVTDYGLVFKAPDPKKN